LKITQAGQPTIPWQQTDYPCVSHSYLISLDEKLKEEPIC